MTVVAETLAGRIEGFSKDGINVFMGVPFAAPPLGKLRWLPPQPVEPWSGIKETKSFSPMSPQVVAPPDPNNPLQVGFSVDTSLGVQTEINEDSLYLNVFTPGIDNARRPVMVWIHGGGFTRGTGSSPMYNGGLLANRGDVVVVSINYRLNVFGFMRLMDITNDRIAATGNEGILDQVAALEWVRDNITAFGGDPDNVTIFGESAGGASVCALLSTPKAKGLFHKAISQSGSAHIAVSQENANHFAERFLKLLEVRNDDIDALQNLTVPQILETYVKALTEMGGDIGPTEPVIDGKVFPKLPIRAIAEGSADGIPLLAGTLSDEWRLWLAFDPALKDLTEAHMINRFKKRLRSLDPQATVDAYRRILAERGAPTTPTDIYLAVMSDRMFRVPTIKLLETHESRGNPAFGYLLTWKSPFKDGIFGACHAMDLGFLWGAYQSEFFGPEPAADTLSLNMQDAWMAFARSGEPACEGLGKWPTYGKQRKTMLLGKESGVTEAPYNEEVGIWDSAEDDVFSWA